MRILIAEDDPTSAYLLERILRKGGYDPVVARDGHEALAASDKECFEAVLTDWMMPHMDGIELIRQLRSRLDQPPFVMVITALTSPGAREHALSSGADEFVSKPFNGAEIVKRLADGLARRRQPMPATAPARPAQPCRPPPFAAVCIAASTGGPETVKQILSRLPQTRHAAFLMVMHGPSWMLETLAARLRADVAMPVRLASDRMDLTPGAIYVAPGERHMVVEPNPLRLRLDGGEAENFVRPAADPLLRTAAGAFGQHTVALVLTGLGRDGTLGAAHVAAAGGHVIAQDPTTALASSMPQSVIDSGSASQVLKLDEIPGALERKIEELARCAA